MIDAKFIGNLPESELPWKLHSYDGIVIAVNPENPPLMVGSDGSLTKVLTMDEVP